MRPGAVIDAVRRAKTTEYLTLGELAQRAEEAGVQRMIEGPGHTGAIGGAIAAMNGADFLCMVSPAEHLALPDVHDIEEGTRVAKIAAHVGDTVRLGDAWFDEGERQMAAARRKLDWKEQFSIALFSDHAQKIHERDGELDTCSMCGDLCALKLVEDILEMKEE